MASISESQQQILHKAVDTASARFIAEVVVNIEEIVVCIKKFLALNCDDKNKSFVDHLQADEVTASELDIKVEPDLELFGPAEPDEAYVDSTPASLVNPALPTSPSPTSDRMKRWTISNKLVSDKETFKCTACKYSTPRRHQFDLHVKLKHGQEETTSREKEVVHKLVSGNQQLIEQSSTRPELRQQFNLPVYPISQPHRADNSKRSHSCTAPDCNFVADNKAELKKHMLAQHPSLCETIKCDQCSFTTKKRANYRQHMKTHLPPEDKPFKCSQCSYSSTNKEGLDIHVNSAHKGVKPYLCDMCGQSFTGISMLSKHKLMKHKPKHLSCPQCDYKTSLQTWMKDHMRKHSTHTPFICQYCSYAAKTAGRLKVHLRIHTGERPYKCHLCDYGAMEGAPLKKHLKNQHQLLVSRIDVREGKLFLNDGGVILTGLATRTMPLPPGSFLGSKHSPPAGERDTNITHSATAATSAINILVEAAALSALPVHSESPPPEEQAGEGTMQYDTLIAADFPDVPNRLPVTGQDNSYS